MNFYDVLKIEKKNVICIASWENLVFAYAKTKAQVKWVVTVQPISAFVFTTPIEQSLYRLNTKFQPLTTFYGRTAQFVSDLVRNPEYRLSHDTAHIGQVV